MPAKPRKAPPRAETKPADDVEPNPAEAAAAEADGNPITFVFRKVEFTAPRDITSNARYRFGFAGARYDEVVLAVLQASDDKTAYGKFMSLIGPGDQFLEVAAEFIGALSTAAGWGNS